MGRRVISTYVARAHATASKKTISSTTSEEEGEILANHGKYHNIFAATYNMHMQGTMFTNQSGKIPHFSSCSKKYWMVLHEIYSNSSWVKPAKNQIKGKSILVRGPALSRIELYDIVPKNQVLDNKIEKNS